jgi:drug/metabolite transporter (DMT)-like permease
VALEPDDGLVLLGHDAGSLAELSDATTAVSRAGGGARSHQEMAADRVTGKWRKASDGSVPDAYRGRMARTAEPARSRDASSPEHPHHPSVGRIWAALLTVYFFWGTTYFAIDRTNQTIPPLVGSGTRFLIAGAVLMAGSRFAGRWRRPTVRDWRTSAIVGTLLMLGGNGSVAISEDLGVPTGIVALIIAMIPLWMALIDRAILRSAPLRRRVVVGLVGGFAGSALLVSGQLSGRVTAPGLAGAVGASLWWSLGSLYSRTAPMPPDPFQASGMQQLVGGVAIWIVAALSGQVGDLEPSRVSGESLAALGYLIVFGSLLTFSCYLWLLRAARTTLVSTYAFVNPIVAVSLGWLVLDEPIVGRTVVAAAMLLSSVALIVSAGRTARNGAAAFSGASEKRGPELEPELLFEGVGDAQQQRLGEHGRGELEADG